MAIPWDLLFWVLVGLIGLIVALFFVASLFGMAVVALFLRLVRDVQRRLRRRRRDTQGVAGPE
jgi:hypothetical protein